MQLPAKPARALGHLAGEARPGPLGAGHGIIVKKLRLSMAASIPGTSSYLVPRRKTTKQ